MDIRHSRYCAFIIKLALIALYSHFSGEYMEHDNKQRSPYKGILVQVFFTVLIPLVLLVLFYFVINKYQGNYEQEQNSLTAIVLATGIGTLFNCSCIIAGIVTPSYLVFKNRVLEFFENTKLSFSFAVKSYFYDMKENGVVFLIYFLMYFLEALICFLSLKTLIVVYLVPYI